MTIHWERISFAVFIHELVFCKSERITEHPETQTRQETLHTHSALFWFVLSSTVR
jgi:hypothetical protein